MQCKHGDLAIIVDDFEGCKGNIGLIVRVIGPSEIVMDMACWKIITLGAKGLWLLDEGKARKMIVSDTDEALHPDNWLRPIRADRVRAKNLELELS
jgi:hypothetical protein